MYYLSDSLAEWYLVEPTYPGLSNSDLIPATSIDKSQITTGHKMSTKNGKQQQRININITSNFNEAMIIVTITIKYCFTICQSQRNNKQKSANLNSLICISVTDILPALNILIIVEETFDDRFGYLTSFKCTVDRA